MATARHWLSGFVGVLAGVPWLPRRERSAPGEDYRAHENRRRQTSRPTGESRYGTWFAETVAYDH